MSLHHPVVLPIDYAVSDVFVSAIPASRKKSLVADIKAAGYVPWNPSDTLISSHQKKAHQREEWAENFED